MTHTKRSLPPESFDSDFEKMKPEYRSNHWAFGMVNSYRRQRELWSSAHSWQKRLVVALPWIVVAAMLVGSYIYWVSTTP